MRAVFKKALLSILLHGVFNLLLGVILFLMQDLTIISTTRLIGVFVFISGLALVIGAFYGRHEDEHWWFLLQSGVLQIVLAALFFVVNDDSAMRMLLLFGVFAIVTGISSIVASLRLWQEMNEISLTISGVVSVLFGCWMIFFPGEGFMEKRLHVAGYTIFLGLATIYLAYRIWKKEKEMTMHIYKQMTDT